MPDNGKKNTVQCFQNKTLDSLQGTFISMMPHSYVVHLYKTMIDIHKHIVTR